MTNNYEALLKASKAAFEHMDEMIEAEYFDTSEKAYLSAQRTKLSDGSYHWQIVIANEFRDFMTHIQEYETIKGETPETIAHEIDACWESEWDEIDE